MQVFLTDEDRAMIATAIATCQDDLSDAKSALAASPNDGIYPGHGSNAGEIFSTRLDARCSIELAISQLRICLKKLIPTGRLGIEFTGNSRASEADIGRGIEAARAYFARAEITAEDAWEEHLRSMDDRAEAAATWIGAEAVAIDAMTSAWRHRTDDAGENASLVLR